MNMCCTIQLLLQFMNSNKGKKKTTVCVKFHQTECRVNWDQE